MFNYILHHSFWIQHLISLHLYDIFDKSKTTMHISTRGCKVLAAERNPQELSEDDVAFWSYVKPDQRPATVGGAADNINVDEESEENVSEEEGDIDEDGMDID